MIPLNKPLAAACASSAVAEVAAVAVQYSAADTACRSVSVDVVAALAAVTAVDAGPCAVTVKSLTGWLDFDSA